MPSPRHRSLEARLVGYGIRTRLKALHRPCVGGEATARLSAGTGPKRSTDPVSVEARLERRRRHGPKPPTDTASVEARLEGYAGKPVNALHRHRVGGGPCVRRRL